MIFFQPWLSIRARLEVLAVGPFLQGSTSTSLCNSGGSLATIVRIVKCGATTAFLNFVHPLESTLVLPLKLPNMGGGASKQDAPLLFPKRTWQVAVASPPA